MLNQINDIEIAKHFKLSEFACPCCKRVMLHPKLLAKLKDIDRSWRIPRKYTIP